LSRKVSRTLSRAPAQGNRARYQRKEPAMQTVVFPPPPQRLGQVAAARSWALLSTLAYRSQSVSPMSDAELQLLLQKAQARNHAEGLTGLLIYDQGRFFQWLEGPSASLARVWNSIRSDPRHTQIEVLGNQSTSVRVFDHLDLKLEIRGLPAEPAALVLARDETELVASLYRGLPEPSRQQLQTPRPRGLLDLVQTVVLPEVVARLAPGTWPTPVADARVHQLAQLLIAAEPAGAERWIDDFRAEGGSLAALYSGLFEPAARSLGDLWSSDDCTEFDVSNGLFRLQSAVRRLGVNASAAAGLPHRAVLVAPHPGEPHMLAATLDADLLWRAGWDTHCEFPANDKALQRLLAGSWFDALDLSLSPAFLREHSLPGLSHTITQARQASKNPGLVVVVGGRVFNEQRDAGDRVGADGSSASALHAERTILRALHSCLARDTQAPDRSVSAAD
jgi:hypothetical protein